jgi:fucose 4-O-acetylase-like acetyltransferase
MLFAISGYLFALGDSKLYLERIGKRFRTIGIPIVLWTGIALLLINIIPNPDMAPRGITPPFEINPLIDPYFLKLSWHDKIYEFVVGSPVGFHLWFLRVLLVLNIAYPLMRLAIKPNAILRWVVFAAVFGLWVSNHYIPYFNTEAVLFFMLGMHLAFSGGIPTKSPFGLASGVWIGLWIALAAGKTYLALAYPSDDIKPLLAYLYKATILTGLFAAWYGMDGLVRACMSNRNFVWLSAFSFFIYALHEPILHIVLRDSMDLAGDMPNYRLITYLFIPTIISAFCIGMGWLVRTASPALYGILTGDRGFNKPAKPLSDRAIMAEEV